MKYTETMLPQRKKLPHEIPPWVAEGRRYFITINCKNRSEDTLCSHGRAPEILRSIEVYEDLQKWFVHALVIMPDHLHLVGTFSRTPGIRATIRAWKAFHARRLGIHWQADFFEHRLRDEDAFTVKIQYLLMNPVRSGLVDEWKKWPYTFVRGDW